MILLSFRLLSEFYPFLFIKNEIFNFNLLNSFRLLSEFYPFLSLTINPLFYDMLFGYFRENYLNFQFFLQKKKNYVLIPIFTVSWQFLYKIIIFVFNFC